MLTSSNQYLRPEYLTPLPTTLDAKKSPLALLAQTCSAIGADTPNPKLLASMEKSTKSSSASKTPTSSANHSTTPTNMNESNNNTITSKPSQSPVNASIRSSPLNSTTSVSPKMPSSFKPYENTPVKSPTLPQNNTESSLRARTPKRTHTPLRSTSSNSSSANSPLPDRTSPIQSSPKTPILPPASSYMLGLPPPLGLDHLKAAYLNYARGLKPEGFNPACRDPYCTGTCVSPMYGAAAGKTCPAGCLQCDHAKTPFAPSTHQQQAMAFAHAQLYALAAAANQPYVCNWISAGDASTYCGKRFSNSEELLQHLRAHTGGSGADLLGPSAAHHLLARGGYPTPPLSPLTLGSGRYHPYSKPMLSHALPPPMVPPHLLPPPVGGLPPYFSPYGSFVPPLPNLAALSQPPSAGGGRQAGGQNGLHH